MMDKYYIGDYLKGAAPTSPRRVRKLSGFGWRWSG